jgi:hypothetical protein
LGNRLLHLGAEFDLPGVYRHESITLREVLTTFCRSLKPPRNGKLTRRLDS